MSNCSQKSWICSANISSATSDMPRRPVSFVHQQMFSVSVA